MTTQEAITRLIATRPEHWTPALIMAAQSFLRRAYLEQTK